MLIGVLALQGAFKEHVQALQRAAESLEIQVDTVLVKTEQDLVNLDGLVLPGGESTVMHSLCSSNNLIGPLKDWAAAGKPTLATCAGLILLAESVDGCTTPLIGGLAVTVQRNAYGRQADSFHTDRIMLKDGSFSQGVFIRAPKILKTSADVVATLDGETVAIQHGNILALAFHPELTGDLYWHLEFVNNILQRSLNL